MIWYSSLSSFNSMTAHQNFLVGMHDTSYDTPLLSAWQRRCTDHLCIALWVFIRLFEKRGEVSNISAARCSHWHRPSWYFNHRKFRWSSDIIKVNVCLWRALMTPWKKIGKVWQKFWWSLVPNRSISHEGSWFPKGDVSIETPVAGDFIVCPHKISMVHNHHYTMGLIFWRISGIVSYI